MTPTKPIDLSMAERMTIDRIVSIIANKIEFITDAPVPPPDADTLESYIHLHDVLEIHNCRDNPTMQTITFQQPRTWNTELDIPVDEYAQAIALAIDMLTHTHNHQMTERSTASITRFTERIAVLRRLKDYRCDNTVAPSVQP